MGPFVIDGMKIGRPILDAPRPNLPTYSHSDPRVLAVRVLTVEATDHPPVTLGGGVALKYLETCPSFNRVMFGSTCWFMYPLAQL